MSDFDPAAYTSDFDPAAYAGVEQPAPEKPGFFKRTAKYLGETLADDVTAYASLGGITNIPMALAGTVGSYFQPDVVTGGGNPVDRYNRQMASIKRQQDEAYRRSPMTTPAAAVAGFGTAAASAPAVLQRVLSPISGAEVTRSVPLIARMAAGTADAAITNTALESARNAYEGGEPWKDVFQRTMFAPENAVGAAIPMVQEAAPAARATFQNVRDMGRRARAKMFGDSAQVAREKFGSYENAGEALGEVTVPQAPKLGPDGKLVEAPDLQVDRPGIPTSQRGTELGIAGKRGKERIGQIVKEAQGKGAKFDYWGMRQEAQELFDQMFKGNPEADRVGSATHEARGQAQALLDQMDELYRPKAVAVQKDVAAAQAGDKVRVFEKARAAIPERDTKTGRMKKGTKGAPELQKSKVEVVGEETTPIEFESPQPAKEPTMHRSADELPGAATDVNERLLPDVTRPAPDSTWGVVIDEPTLPKTEKLKGALQTEANVDRFGRPIPETAKAASPILTFKDRLSGIIKGHGEKAISAVDPDLGREFLRNKRLVQTTETFGEPTLEAGDIEFKGSSQHREVYPTKHGIFYKAMQMAGRHVNPQLSRAGHWAEGRINNVGDISPYASALQVGAAADTQQKNSFKLRPRAVEDFIAEYLRQRSQ